MPSYAPGAEFVGRVTAKGPRSGSFFVDIGAGPPGYLEMAKSGPQLNEGAMIAVSVKRAPRGEKGASLAYKGAAETGGSVGPTGPARDPLLDAADALAEAPDTEIIVDSGVAKAVLENSPHVKELGAVTHEAGALFDRYGVSAALEEAFSRKIVTPSRANVFIDETEALTAIDVDMGAAASGAKQALRLNIEAARVAEREVRRREIGGQIVVDFLKTPRAEEKKLSDELKAIFPDARQAGWSKSGLFFFTLARAQASLLARFTAPVEVDPVSGRAFTIDWLAKTAIRMAEARAVGAPTARITLGAGAAIFDYLTENSHWLERLTARFGARIAVRRGDGLKEREFDIGEQ